MKFGLPLRPALAGALLLAASCSSFSATEVTRLCPSIPVVRVSPDPGKPYGTKDHIKASLVPMGSDGSHYFSCPATVCFTLDGSEPLMGRAATFCMPAPVKEIPVDHSLTIKYFVVGKNGSQGAVQKASYSVEPPPISYCDPKSKQSKEDIDVRLTMSKSGEIYYTLDGNDPDTEDPATKHEVEPKIRLKEGRTIVKFRAKDTNGNLEDKTNTCEYKVDKTPPITTADPLGGSSSGAVNVKLSSNKAATIYYTTDGSTPAPERLEPNGTAKSDFLEANITLTQSSYVRFYGIDTVGNVETPVNEQVYIIGGKPAVAVDPSPGIFSQTSVAITMRGQPSNPADTIEIWYTVNNTPAQRNGVNSRKYSTPITDFATEGEFTLRYVAVEMSGLTVMGTTSEYTAVYQLGVNAPPFYREINFTEGNLYDSSNSTVGTVEYNTHKGFARLRRKRPLHVGGVSMASSAPNPFLNVIERAEVAYTGGNPFVHVVSPNDLRVFDLTALPSISELTIAQKSVPEGGYFSLPCGETNLVGFLLGITVFQAYGKPNAITPYTNAGNCGGFAHWVFNYASATTRDATWVKANRTQFANTQDDTPTNDYFEGGTVLPKSSTASATLNGRPVLFQPQNNGSNLVLASYADTLTAVSGLAPFALTGRATALDIDDSLRFLAVGDSTGKIYVLGLGNLALTDPASQLSAPCATGVPCRINGITWYRPAASPAQTFIMAAIGYYERNQTGTFANPVSGQVIVAEVDAAGKILGVKPAALPAADDYIFNSSVEDIKVLPSGTGVAAVREQGLVLLNLSSVVASKTVSSLGYFNGADYGDSYFFATSLSPFPVVGLSLPTKFAVVDSGRYQLSPTSPLRTDTSFQILDAYTPNKWETDGTLLTTNFNNSNKRVNRVRLSGSIPSTLPAGLTLTLIGDGVENTQPLNVGTDIVFTNPPLDVRAKLKFASTDDNNTIMIDYLQFKLSPVQ